MNVEVNVETIGDTRVYFESIVQTVREPLLILDEELRVISANAAFYRLFKVSKEETEHKRIDELGSGQWGMDGLMQILGKAIPDNEQFQDYELKYVFPQIGYKVMLLNGRRIEQGAGQPRMILVSFEDTTEQVERENKIKQYTAKLEDNNEQLNAFDYTLSHDLRAPLNIIVQFAELLKNKEAKRLDDESRHMLGVLQSRAREMEDYIRDLLKFSHIGWKAEKGADFDMTEMARAVALEAQASLPERELRIKVQPLPQAHGDPAMVRQVWVNLLDNAVKFTRSKKEAVIEIEGSLQGNENVYSIKDNGIGFDTQNAGKLFKLFQRLNAGRDYEGTGAGLAIVQRIVHQHGGRVWVNAKPDEGATFYFTLPKQ